MVAASRGSRAVWRPRAVEPGQTPGPGHTAADTAPGAGQPCTPLPGARLRGGPRDHPGPNTRPAWPEAPTVPLLSHGSDRTARGCRLGGQWHAQSRGPRPVTPSASRAASHVRRSPHLQTGGQDPGLTGEGENVLEPERSEPFLPRGTQVSRSSPSQGSGPHLSAPCGEELASGILPTCPHSHDAGLERSADQSEAPAPRSRGARPALSSWLPRVTDDTAGFAGTVRAPTARPSRAGRAPVTASAQAGKPPWRCRREGRTAVRGRASHGGEEAPDGTRPGPASGPFVTEAVSKLHSVAWQSVPPVLPGAHVAPDRPCGTRARARGRLVPACPSAMGGLAQEQ